MPERSRDAWEMLVSDLYLSALDPSAAARLPSHFTSLTGGVIASLWQLDRHTLAPVDRMLTSAPPEALEAYASHYYRHDPWADAVHTARFGTVLHGAEIVGDAAFAQSLYYGEFAAKYDMFHMLGAIVPLGPGSAAQVGAVTVLRPRSAGAFDQEAASTLARVLPHLGSALQLRTQVGDRVTALRSEALGAALDMMGVPAAVLDGHGTVVRFNHVAQPLIEQALPQGHTVLALASGLDVAGRDRLTRIIAAAAKGDAGGQAWLPHPSRPMLVTITALPDALAGLAAADRDRVLMVLRPLGHETANGLARSVAAVFGLTAAEAQAAAALAGGQSPDEIARAKGTKVSTVRTLLARAQDRTGARNLRDLVRILGILG